MALSSGNNGAQNKLFILKPVSSKNGEKVRPYFEVSKSEEGKWIAQDDQSINHVTGELTKVEPLQEEYKGEKYYRVRIFLKDGEELYMVPCRMNIATRSLFNSLFSLTSFENISIRYYQTKTGYDSFFVSQNEEKVRWKYENEDLPVATEVMFKGKLNRDFTDVDKFFIEKLEEFNKRLSAKPAETEGSGSAEKTSVAKKKAKTPKTSEEWAEGAEGAEEVGSEEIPF